MASWSAQIVEKSKVTSDGELTYGFSILRDKETVNGVLTVTGSPSSVQQMIVEKIKVYAEAYELAEGLPRVGEVLEIIKNA